MPTYLYQCGEGHAEEVWRSIHERTLRVRKCPECGRTARLTMTAPAISAAALPNKMQDVRDADEREKRWNKDLPAYYRLRKEGLQPRGIDGSHLVEQEARDALEVEMGRPLGEHLSQAKEATAELRQNDPKKKGPEIGAAKRAGVAL